MNEDFIINTGAVEDHIQNRRQEIIALHKLSAYVQELHNSVGLNKSTLDDINTKISSRMAFLDKSILVHEKILAAHNNPLTTKH